MPRHEETPYARCVAVDDGKPLIDMDGRFIQPLHARVPSGRDPSSSVELLRPISGLRDRLGGFAWIAHSAPCVLSESSLETP
jgi:hypothetical protein